MFSLVTHSLSSFHLSLTRLVVCLVHLLSLTESLIHIHPLISLVKLSLFAKTRTKANHADWTKLNHKRAKSSGVKQGQATLWLPRGSTSGSTGGRVGVNIKHNLYEDIPIKIMPSYKGLAFLPFLSVCLCMCLCWLGLARLWIK